jgi:DNA/RNA-binding domain of Phe-tRNA-synthetase-like protein
LRLAPGLEGSCRLGLVEAAGLRPPVEREEAPEWLAEIVGAAQAAGEAFWPEGVKRAVRDLLKHGKYRATGRGKPASEFLLNAALTGEFPVVCDLVDVNNAVSLACGYPASILDADLAGPELLVRRGTTGEAYVFNRAGHAIDLEDLLVVCRRTGDDWEPCGNPVKDAMATKVHAGTTSVAAVLYQPVTEPAPRLEAACARFALLLRAACGAERAAWRVVDASTVEET